MRHHREVIAIELKDLVIDQEPGLARGAVRSDLCNVDSVVSITLTLLKVNLFFIILLRFYLRTFPVILIYPTSNFETTFELCLGHARGALLVEDDGDGEAGDGGAWLVGERKVHCQDARLIFM